jgi:outer membrane lipoprotein-sorting protein
MKSNLFLIGLIILSLNPLWAQPQTTKLKEDESSVILKEIQQKLISLHSAEINFSLQTVKEGKTINSTKGQLWIKGDKYKLIIPSQHVYCDSINVWNYLPEQNEVNISLYDPQSIIGGVVNAYKTATIHFVGCNIYFSIAVGASGITAMA